MLATSVTGDRFQQFNLYVLMNLIDGVVNLEKRVGREVKRIKMVAKLKFLLHRYFPSMYVLYTYTYVYLQGELSKSAKFKKKMHKMMI